MKRIHALSCLLIFSMFLTFSLPLSAQKDEKAKLEAKQKKLQKEIKYTRKLINETKSKRMASLSEIALLNNQINNRKALIRSYGVEISMLEQKVAENKRLIKELENKIVNMKKEYARLIEQSYKTRNQMDKWVFIFSSEDFYQGYQRYKYIERINDFRKEKIERIQEAQEELRHANELLEAQKQQRVDRMIQKETETSELNENKREKQSKASQLRAEENSLRAKLVKKQKEDAAVRAKLKKIIEEILRKKNKGKKPGSKITKTDWEIKLAKDFISNKGKLPWPTPNGKVVLKYGTYPHPDFPSIKLNNDGVDIRCEKGTISRAVFKGEVMQIVKLPTKGVAVMVNHGDYITVYKNLAEIYVAEGDRLETKQEIGKVYTNPNTNETIFHFELWKIKGQSALPNNPAGWVYRLK